MLNHTTKQEGMYQVLRVASADPRKWRVVRSDGFEVGIHRTKRAAQADADRRNQSSQR